MKKLKMHPLASLLPMMGEEEFAEFKEDIRINGIQLPVVVHEGLLLDGRNRYRAASELGIECPTSECLCEDPLAFVISANVKRRHLNESQRAMVAARIASLGEGRPSKTAQICAVSQADAAAMVNVSRRTVQFAKTVQQSAVPELVAAVEAGRIPVSAAADAARLPPERQLAALAKGESGVRTTASKARRDDLLVKLGARTLALPDKRYNIISPDFPWRYETRSELGMGRAPKYPTMSIEEIRRFPLLSVAAPDFMLAMWASNPFMHFAHSLIDLWELEYKQTIVWLKTNVDGTLHRGNGYWGIDAHESVLIATRGRIPAFERGKQPLTVIEAPVRRHSEKPDIFYDIVHEHYPTLPKLDIFARSPHEGWTPWGYEAPPEDEE